MAFGRVIHADTLAELVKPVFFPIVLVHLDWPGGALYVHGNIGDLSWNSQTWGGIGAFGNVSLPAAGQGIAVEPAALTLVGAPDDIDDVLSADLRGIEGDIHFGTVSEAKGATLIGEPFEIFRGTVQAKAAPWTPVDGGTLRGARLTLRQGPSQRASATLIHNGEDQSAKFPGDTAGRHVQNAEARLVTRTWPS